MNDLAYSITSSLMNAAIQANVDALGHENAFQVLEMHIRHNARWCIAAAQPIVGVNPIDTASLLTLLNWYLCMPHRGQNRCRLNEDGEVQIEVIGCRQNGAFPNQCEWYCYREIPMMCEESDPELAMRLEKSLWRGDDRCSWKIVYRDGRRWKGETTSFKDMEKPTRSIEVMDGMGCGGASEFMVMATESLLECIDHQKAVTLLQRNAMRAGEEFGSFLLSRRKTETINPVEALEFLDSLLEIEADSDCEGLSNGEKRIRSCPFRDSIEEICMQIQAFKQGMLDVISPGSMISYQIKGNPCTIQFQAGKQKTSVQNSIIDKKMTTQDFLLVLKSRLARGEISTEEYNEMKRMIQDD